jgi:hypothetical protein
LGRALRAEAVLHGRTGRRFVRAPEYRALEQIVADAQRAGRPVIALGPAGFVEITG